MFEFRYVELMNWAYWPTIKLPLDERTIMISGPNGSGKTTFLDALRTLLRAPRLSANRRFTDYLFGNVDTAVVKAVVTNDFHQRERRPFEFRGFSSDLVTLATILKRRSGRWQKQFAILDGDVPLADLRELRRSELISPENYTYEIQTAGFSAAFLKVLALEQGQTDKLCEKSPTELLDLVLEVHGDKAVIDRYKQARENYQLANIEVNQLGARLAEEQAKLVASQKKAEEYQRYEKLCEDLQEFEGRLIPQAEYKAAKRQIDEASLIVNDMSAKLKPVDREIIEIDEMLANAETEKRRREDLVLQARETKEELEKKERDLDIHLNNLSQEWNALGETLKAAANAKAEPVKPLQRQLEETQREIARLEIRREEEIARRDQLKQDQGGSGRRASKIYPHYVEEFIHELRQKKIKHSLLCDMVEITDQSWQMAIESILGRDRFTVLVDQTDQLAARQLGESLRYRHYVVAREKDAGAKVKPDSDQAAANVVSFTEDGAPRWIQEALARTILVEDVRDGMKQGAGVASVTRKGYRQDRRGGISIAVDHFYCGSLGQDSQKEELGRQMTDADKQVGGLERDLGKARQKVEKLQERLHVQESLKQASSARQRKEFLDGEVARVNAEHKQSLALRHDAERMLIETLDDLSNFERDCEEKSKVLLDGRGKQSSFLDEIRDQQQNIQRLTLESEEIATRLGPKLLTDKKLADVPDLDELTPKYYAVQNLLEAFAEEPPEATAVDIFEHHQTQYDRQRQLYEDHEAGLRNWESEFRLAQQKYVIVVEHTLREYRKNVISLSELSMIDADVIVPDLRSHPDALESAGLTVRFGFDGKRAVDIRGSQHSGGQRVVASLILLMSLATSGGVNRGGFFIIDEPFAHLSLERIDDVSRFLERTECQFILTSPATHNVNVFSASRLQVNFRIKKQRKRFAPLPTIIRR